MFVGGHRKPNQPNRNNQPYTLYRISTTLHQFFSVYHNHRQQLNKDYGIDRPLFTRNRPPCRGLFFMRIYGLQHICLPYVFLLVNNNLLYMVCCGIIYMSIMRYHMLGVNRSQYVGYNILTASNVLTHNGWSLNHWR